MPSGSMVVAIEHSESKLTPPKIPVPVLDEVKDGSNIDEGSIQYSEDSDYWWWVSSYVPSKVVNR